MKIIHSYLKPSDFRKNFSHRHFINKKEIRQILSHKSDLSEQVFRRILYSLEKEGRIIPIGAGLFAVNDGERLNKKSKFSPSISSTVMSLSIDLKENFPFAPHIIWETSCFREFMVNQPTQNLVIIETEKDIIESFFYHLKQKSLRDVFIDTDQKTFERYISGLSESILILNSITQSPTILVEDVLTAKLEKILVDIFADEERFFAFHGQELINIFENAFTTYWINPKTLFRYASRRNVDGRIKNFITHQTHINLSEFAVEN